MMAIYSLHHSSIGKATQEEPYTAAAHITYITRERAMSRSAGARVPGGNGKARDFLVEHEQTLRKNGRVADKLMLALPRELKADERLSLIEAFAEEVTDGRATWFAAFHEKGKDSHNPHCHLVIVDRDVNTRRRVFGMSERGSTERLRKLWEKHANAALAKAKRPERIDHRTLAAQGKERAPTIHIGVRSLRLVRRRMTAPSRPRDLKNSCLAKSRSRQVDYRPMDRGQSRFGFNLEIRRTNFRKNQERDCEVDYWKELDQDAFLRDIRDLRRIQAALEYTDDRQHAYRARDERELSSDPALEL